MGFRFVPISQSLDNSELPQVLAAFCLEKQSQNLHKTVHIVPQVGLPSGCILLNSGWTVTCNDNYSWENSTWALLFAYMELL
jgi:hypothetical protein